MLFVEARGQKLSGLGLLGASMERFHGQDRGFRAVLDQFWDFLGSFGGYLIWGVDPKFFLIALVFDMNCV